MKLRKIKLLEIYQRRFTNNINIFVMLILASLPGIMLELKYGYDVFYDVRIRAIASFLSVLSVPAYALVWTIFLSYFNKYIKCFFVCLTVIVLMLDVYCYTQ